MTYEFFKSILHAEPFKPFRIYLKSGRVIERSFPGNMLVTHNFGIAVGIPSDKDPHIAGESVWIQPEDITRIEVEGKPVVIEAKRNGSAA
jgi:hypothetical protein